MRLEFDAAVDEALRRTESPLIVDLSSVGYLDTTALSTLVRAYQQTQRQSDTLSLVVPAGSTRKLFSITNLDRLFSIHETLDEAISASAPGAHPESA